MTDKNKKIDKPQIPKTKKYSDTGKFNADNLSKRDRPDTTNSGNVIKKDKGKNAQKNNNSDKE